MAKFVRVGTEALIELEQRIANELDIEALKVSYIMRRSGRLERHDTRLTYLAYFVAAAFWSAAAVYALFKI
jgi:hypothetical protein